MISQDKQRSESISAHHLFNNERDGNLVHGFADAANTNNLIKHTLFIITQFNFISVPYICPRSICFHITMFDEIFDKFLIFSIWDILIRNITKKDRLPSS